MTDQPIEHVPGQAQLPAAAPAGPPADDSTPAPAPASDVPYDETYVVPDQAEQDALTAQVPDDPQPYEPDPAAQAEQDALAPRVPESPQPGAGPAAAQPGGVLNPDDAGGNA